MTGDLGMDDFYSTLCTLYDDLRRLRESIYYPYVELKVAMLALSIAIECSYHVFDDGYIDDDYSLPKRLDYPVKEIAFTISAIEKWRK